MNSFSNVFLLFVLASSLVLAGAVQVFGEAPGVIVVVGSDTVWTKADNPHELTGPVLVNQGVTLTIEAGASVNLNGYELRVNGTLRAIGTASDNIQISGGTITFGDSHQAGLGSAFENAVINSTISSSNPLKMNNNTVNEKITVGDSSELISNNILRSVTTGSTTIILNNKITGDVSVGDSCIIANNTLKGDITTGKSARILNNIINGSRFYPKPPGGGGYTIALTVDDSSEIINNTISGGVEASSSAIMKNIISGGAPFTDWGGRGQDSTSAVTVNGDSSIVANTIFSSTGGYGILIRSGYTYVSSNVIHNYVRVAGDALIENNLLVGTGIQVGHIHVNAYYEIDYGHGDSIIRNNTITGGGVAISSGSEGGTSTIIQNLLFNNSIGIVVSSQMSILNNTLSNCSIGIQLYSPTATIAYNNIVNYTQNSVYLSSVLSDVDATNNWWGTTDTQAINLTIRDFKYDFDLGKVNFVPLLTEPNPEAPSKNLEIPEFESWIVLPMFLVATFVMVVARKGLTKGTVC